ncbi:MAG TPA: GFA family protein [Devosiaceae bacterium]|jgi:hypothetical protein
MPETHSGGCLCGAVRYTVTGEPLLVGICHCADCRKESGSAFVTYAKWPKAGFTLTGEMTTFRGRSFCARCGSRLMNLHEDDVEIRIGSLDAAPNRFQPQQEGWIKRREPWLRAVAGASQSEEDTPL